MKSLSLSRALLISVFLSSHLQAGKYVTQDGRWSWDYDAKAKTARLESTQGVKMDLTVGNVEAYGRWDEKAPRQLAVILEGPWPTCKIQMKSLMCRIDETQGRKRFEITVKETGQGDFKRFIELHEAAEGTSVPFQGKLYGKLLGDYFEKTEVVAVATGITGLLCKQAPHSATLVFNRGYHDHTRVQGAVFNGVQKTLRKLTLSAGKADETETVLGMYAEPIHGALDETERVYIDTQIGCPAHPDKGHLGSYNHEGCLHGKYPSWEELLARLNAPKSAPPPQS